MTYINEVKCDYCDARTQDAHGWRWFEQAKEPHGSERLHFCSWTCLGNYAMIATRAEQKRRFGR